MRVTICDPVEGRVSPDDIKAYLVATGWKLLDYGYFERGEGDENEKDYVRCPRDDDSAKLLETAINDLAFDARCSPGATLRAIEAHARGEDAVEPLATRRRRRR